jgi:hypothetical protein
MNRTFAQRLAWSHTAVACVVAIFAAAGCCPPPPPPPTSYFGPTDPMSRVVEGINANAAKINTLRVTHSYDARIVDDKGKEHTFSGDGYLLFRKPDDLLLVAKVLTQDAFTVGSNADRYWFTVPQQDTMWWGRKANLTAEKARQIPIRPDLILEVLGVFTVDTNFGQFPAPVMRFNHDRDCYMFTFVAPTPDRFVAVKEVWYDRRTLLPICVNLFDPNGRTVLRAYLSNPKEVEGANGGKLATQFDLLFVDDEGKHLSQMNFRLKDVRDHFKNLPNDASFAFPDEPGVGKIIEIK